MESIYLKEGRLGVGEAGRGGTDDVAVKTKQETISVHSFLMCRFIKVSNAPLSDYVFM
jgi:hypothetical protein